MRTLPSSLIFSALALVALSGCSTKDPEWVGTYNLSGQWNLSGPLVNGRTVGDAVSDLLVEEIVNVTGVPSFAEDDVAQFVSSAVRNPVKNTVDANAPAPLAPDGMLTAALASSLANVRIKSVLTLDTGLFPGSMEGHEVMSNIEFDSNGTSTQVPPQDLLSGVTMEAEWSGSEGDDGILEEEPHTVKIQFGELVRRVAATVISDAEQQNMQDQVVTSVDCPQIVNDILGGGVTFEISVSKWSYSVSNAELETACEQTKNGVHSNVLGLFASASFLEVGGNVQYKDSDYNGQADELSTSGPFGGLVSLAPEAIAPKVFLSFQGTRQ